MVVQLKDHLNSRQITTNWILDWSAIQIPTVLCKQFSLEFRYHSIKWDFRLAVLSVCETWSEFCYMDGIWIPDKKVNRGINYAYSHYSNPIWIIHKFLIWLATLAHYEADDPGFEILTIILFTLGPSKFSSSDDVIIRDVPGTSRSRIRFRDIKNLRSSDRSWPDSSKWSRLESLSARPEWLSRCSARPEDLDRLALCRFIWAKGLSSLSL